MTFLVDLYTQGQEERLFSFSGVSLDTGLDIISALARKGDQLRRVRCLEKGVLSNYLSTFSMALRFPNRLPTWNRTGNTY